MDKVILLIFVVYITICTASNYFLCFSNDKYPAELVPVLLRTTVLLIILVVKRTRILC